MVRYTFAHSDPHDVRSASLELALIIPTFNERDNIVLLLTSLQQALVGIECEIIFVDDNSSDGTADLIASFARDDRTIRLIRRFGRRGLASAVIEGILASAAPACLVMDADLQHDESIIPQLFTAISEPGTDLAIATRYAGGGSIGDWDEGRAWVSRLATRLAATLLRTHISDPMSGFFAVRREAFMEALPQLSASGYKILLDIVSSAPRPLMWKEIPYRFRQRTAGESKLDGAVAIEYGMLLLDKLIGRFIPPRMLLFLAVGAFGLLVHLSVLALALRLSAPFQFAQTAAVMVSMTANFLLNNSITYRDRKLRGWQMLWGLCSFYAVCGIGAIANVGVGAAIYKHGQTWWLAGIAGAAVGSVWNFVASSVLTWKKK